MERFQTEKDKVTPDRRELLLNVLPVFFADMEMELGNDASPAWDTSFVRAPYPTEAVKGIWNHSQNVSFDPNIASLAELIIPQPVEMTHHRITSSGIFRMSSKDAERSHVKRQATDMGNDMDVKRQRFEDDVSEETVAQILTVINDPKKMLGPEVNAVILNY